MVQVHTINISPPLLNSSCAWSSDLSQLRALYDCPFTGAITTRTATLDGFKEDERHTVVFTSDTVSSLNSYGYSPFPLQQYLEWAYDLLTNPTTGTIATKPIIISITESSPTLVGQMISLVQILRQRLKDTASESLTDLSRLVAVELNTSCPNIPNHPPPSYDPSVLSSYLQIVASAFQDDPTLTVGLKLPPYVYAAQFRSVIDAISEHTFTVAAEKGFQRFNPVAYIACTNTLGSSLLFGGQVIDASVPPNVAALPTTFGGLAGDSIHPIALGNVHSFSHLISSHPDPAMQKVKIIGIGGVTSRDAASRMYQAGAHIVGCATLFGQHGSHAFELLAISK
ncbi:FMN-linked oxidoreductase [Cristinia sonorae]|uniref:Dihydroorotate oxidase n=1 Tax=Cristinia sonorae TaxID=1940300 RepID=A0A8K0UQQ5_9AGAR|nr:FMN-linked oxidoreductase [Cristinia sonorae]